MSVLALSNDEVMCLMWSSVGHDQISVEEDIQWWYWTLVSWSDKSDYMFLEEISSHTFIICQYHSSCCHYYHCYWPCKRKAHQTSRKCMYQCIILCSMPLGIACLCVLSLFDFAYYSHIYSMCTNYVFIFYTACPTFRSLTLIEWKNEQGENDWNSWFATNGRNLVVLRFHYQSFMAGRGSIMDPMDSVNAVLSH